MTSAELCRANGWKVGDVIEAEWILGPQRMLLTAIGEELVLGRLCNSIDPALSCESAWMLGALDWHKVDTSTKGD